jgi:hypothetical protein
MNQRIGWPSGLVAVGFLALVGVMFWRATENMDNFDKIWAVAGPVLGVVVGAIPGFFFAQNARRDQREAHQRAEAYAAALPEAQRPVAMSMLRQIRDTGQQQ